MTNFEEVRRRLAARTLTPPPPPPITPPPSNNGSNPLQGHTYCPTCGNNISTDERSIDAGMAMGLWTQYYYCIDNGLDPLQPVHAACAAIWKPYTDSGSQFEWWGFIYRDPDLRKGWWGMCPDGVTWVLNRSRVPKYARLVWDIQLGKRRPELIDDNTPMGLQRVNIREAMGTKFDFDDLMSHRSPH